MNQAQLKPRTARAMARSVVAELWLSRRGSYEEAVAEAEERGLIQPGILRPKAARSRTEGKA